MAIVSVQDISRDYEQGSHTVRALRGVDLEIEAGEFVALMGQNAIPRAALSDTTGEVSQSYLGQIHDEHARIVGAISNGDAEEARQAMRTHLLGSQRRYRALLQGR